MKNISVAVIFAAALVGCGQQPEGAGSGGSGGVGGSGAGAGGAAGTVQPGTGPYQPLTVNATWTYHVDDKGVKYDKVSLVEALEDIGGPKAGMMGYRVKDTFPATTQLTWYRVVDTLVVRDHEQSLDLTGALKTEDWYDPYRLRIDESAAHMTSGVTWMWSYADAHTSLSKPMATSMVTETWTVVGVDEPVTVPAGTFATLHLTHVDPTASATKSYWFARGVGKVREETTAGHIEELASYQIP